MNHQYPAPGVSGSSSEVRWSQRISGLLALRPLLEERGIAIEPLLARVGLAPEAFQSPEQHAPFAALAQLLRLAIEASGCEHVGVDVGARWLKYDGDSVMLRRALCSATVGEALEVVTVFQRLNSQGGAAYLLRQSTLSTMGFAVFRPHIALAAPAYDVALSSLVTGVRRFLGSDAWAPDEVLLPRARPRDVQPYRAFFRCRIQFDADRACFRFPAYVLARPMPAADPVAARALEAAALRGMQEHLLPRVYRSLRLLLLDGAVTGDGVAQQLSMHRRTLDRRLRELGTSFQSVLDEVRFDTARQLLAETELPVTAIAASIGYTESSSFVRVFRRWTGTSPQRWRVQNAVSPPSTAMPRAA